MAASVARGLRFGLSGKATGSTGCDFGLCTIPDRSNFWRACHGIRSHSARLMRRTRIMSVESTISSIAFSATHKAAPVAYSSFPRLSSGSVRSRTFWHSWQRKIFGSISVTGCIASHDQQNKLFEVITRPQMRIPLTKNRSHHALHAHLLIGLIRDSSGFDVPSLRT